MWTRAWIGLLLIGGGLGGWGLSEETEPAGPSIVTGRMGFGSASVAGDLEVRAKDGALLSVGPPGLWALEAETFHVRIVRVVQEWADNPLGHDVTVKIDETEKHLFRAPARIELTEVNATSVVYAISDGPSGGILRVPLGAVLGEPFVTTAEPAGYVAGEAGLSYAFEHMLPARSFGVAQGKLSAPFAAGMGAVTGEGALRIVLDHLTFSLEDDGEDPLEIRTGEWITSATQVGLLTPRYRTERVYAVLEATQASMLLRPASDARFLAPRPTYILDGTLALHDAAGGLHLGPEPRSLEGAVLLEGHFAIAPLPPAEEQTSPLLPAHEASASSAAIEGRADELRVNGRSVLSATPDAARTATSVAIMAGLAAALGALLQKIVVLLAPFYARLSAGETLRNPRRLHVYRLVQARPFIHLRGIQRATGLGFGSVIYHTRMLRRSRLVSVVRVSGQELLFAPMPGFSQDALRRLALLAHPTRARIADCIARGGGASQAELQRDLRLTQGMLSRQLALLREAGLIRVAPQRVDAARQYTPSPLLQRWLAGPAGPRGPAVPAPVPGFSQPVPARPENITA